MNTFVKALSTSRAPTARTSNGAPTNITSYNRCLDLFAVVGGALPKPTVCDLFTKAYAENEDTALRIMLWSRDCRGGAGRKDNLRTILQDRIIPLSPELACSIISKLPELGYWKDVYNLYSIDNSTIRSHIIDMASTAIFKHNDALAAKWFPRKGKLFLDAASYMGITLRKLRKTVVALTRVVESQMSANKWDAINYSQVPSQAGINYRNAFKRHDTDRYTQWQLEVMKGRAKINTTQLLPHNIVDRMTYTPDQTLRNAWDCLPNFFDPKDNATLPVIDVSGSMNVILPGAKSAMNIGIALGIYAAQHNESAFRGYTIKFSSSPSWVDINGLDIYEAVSAVKQRPIGLSTNLQAVFDLILDTALENKVAPEDMPRSLLIISDMEFNAPEIGARNTNFEVMSKKYREAGYKKPQVIFWNIRGRQGNSPVTRYDEDVALISGYSPSILNSVLRQSFLDPVSIMLNTVSNERYSIKS